MLSGMREMMTPATGIKPRKKIMIPRPSNCGKPRIHKKVTDRTAFVMAIKNWTSITFPKELMNLTPKWLKFIKKDLNLARLNLEVKRMILSFSNKKNRLSNMEMKI